MPSKAGPRLSKQPLSQERKVSMLNQSLANTIAETICDQLKTATAPVKLTLVQLNSVREELLDLGSIGSASPLSESVSEIVRLLDSDPDKCRRLRPYTFATVIELLLHAQNHGMRGRGLFILANFVYQEVKDTARGSNFVNDSTLIGQNCLISLCELLCESTEDVSCRRWAGSLILGLVASSEDNQDTLRMMPESRRTKLGSAVLYGSSEILRAVAGRIVSILIRSGHPTEKYFATGTAASLISNYPDQDPSASQWDKTFQEYLDNIWEEIAIDNESSGELHFGLNVVTVPSHRDVQTSQRQRSVYMEFANSIHLFIPSEDEVFDLAIDLPYSSISAMRIGETLLDTKVVQPPAAVVLEFKDGSAAAINSAEAQITSLSITVENRAIAGEILKSLTEHSAMLGAAGVDLHQTAKKSSRTNSQESTRSKVSWADETLEFEEDYTASTPKLPLPDNEGSDSRKDSPGNLLVVSRTKTTQLLTIDSSPVVGNRRSDVRTKEVQDVVIASLDSTKPLTKKPRLMHPVEDQKLDSNADVVSPAGTHQDHEDVYDIVPSPKPRTAEHGSTAARKIPRPENKSKSRPKPPIKSAKRNAGAKEPPIESTHSLDKSLPAGRSRKRAPIPRKRKNQKNMKELSDSEEAESDNGGNQNDTDMILGVVEHGKLITAKRNGDKIIDGADRPAETVAPISSNLSRPQRKKSLSELARPKEPTIASPPIRYDGDLVSNEEYVDVAGTNDDDNTKDEAQPQKQIHKSQIQNKGQKGSIEKRLANTMASIFAGAINKRLGQTKIKEDAPTNTRTSNSAYIAAQQESSSDRESTFSPEKSAQGKSKPLPASKTEGPANKLSAEAKAGASKVPPGANKDTNVGSDILDNNFMAALPDSPSVTGARQSVPRPRRLPQKRSAPALAKAPGASQTPQHFTSSPKSTPILVDDYVARKTPLVAFGKHGPKNQGFSSATKPMNLARDGPSKLKSAAKSRALPNKRPQERHPDSEADRRLTKKQKTDALIDLITSDVGSENEANSSLQRIATSSGILGRSGSSVSIVDHNGSPRMFRAGEAKASDHVFAQYLDGPTLAAPYSREVDDGVNCLPSDDDDEIQSRNDSLFSGRKPPPFTGNRKVQPSGPEELLDFEKRYTPHHAFGNEYVALGSRRAVIPQEELIDPFARKKESKVDFHSKTSETAQKTKRLEIVDAEKKSEPAKPLRAPKIVAFQKEKVMFTRHAVVDPDKTLVEEQDLGKAQFRRESQLRYLAASSDSESEDSNIEVQAEESSPEQIWREALKPHQKHLSNMLHYTVDTLLQQLFDKEQAVTLVAPQFSRNGSNVVSSLAADALSGRRALDLSATVALKKAAATLRVTKSTTRKVATAAKQTTKAYEAWRSRQHALQRLPHTGRSK